MLWSEQNKYKVPLGYFAMIVVYCIMLIFVNKTGILTAGIITVKCIVFYFAFTKKYATKMLCIEEEIGVIEELV